MVIRSGLQPLALHQLQQLQRTRAKDERRTPVKD